MDTVFYRIVRPIVKGLFYLLFRPTVIGRENIPDLDGVVLAGNHTKWLDPIMLVSVQKRQVHFLAKEELFHGVTKPIVKGMGAIPVNRKIHDRDALECAIHCLNEKLCVGVFPEGTINRTDDIIMPFKTGAVRMASQTGSILVPFVITGKYRLFRKGIVIEFLKGNKISNNTTKENERLMKSVAKKLEEAKENEK